ncbi:DUF3080 family protein [Aliiglaciecola sp. SL4]|uniref:DUF3080 family protein n=1 Tax=Aliiglaciecola sp. SL4 TaxID=3239806 RepID=UPI00355AF8FC
MSSTQWLLFFGCLTLLTACGQPSIQANFHAYQKQVSDALNITLQFDDDRPSLGYPAAEKLKVNLPETNIKLRDFYALKHCAVSLLIAQRNTALGKVQLPSQRFAYEVKLIQGLQECLQQTSDNDQQQQLRQWITDKQETLPIVWAQMILSSSEIRRTLSSNTELFTQVNQNQLQAYEASLSLLVTLYSPKPTDIDDLETALNTMRKQPLAAQIWQTQIQLRIWLNELNDSLSLAFSELSCSVSSSSLQIEDLKLVYQRNFIKKILPATNRLTSAANTLAPYFQDLQENPVLANEFKVFLRQRKSDYDLYIDALRRHQLLWQNLFRQCQPSN